MGINNYTSDQICKRLACGVQIIIPHTMRFISHACQDPRLAPVLLAQVARFGALGVQASFGASQHPIPHPFNTGNRGILNAIIHNIFSIPAGNGVLYISLDRDHIEPSASVSRLRRWSTFPKSTKMKNSNLAQS